MWLAWGQNKPGQERDAQRGSKSWGHFSQNGGVHIWGLKMFLPSASMAAWWSILCGSSATDKRKRFHLLGISPSSTERHIQLPTHKPTPAKCRGPRQEPWPSSKGELLQDSVKRQRQRSVIWGEAALWSPLRSGQLTICKWAYILYFMYVLR